MRRLPITVPIPPSRPQPPWRRVAAVGVAGLAIALVLLGLQLMRWGPDPTSVFFVGQSFGLDEALAARGEVVETTASSGYDGQWFLGLAYDPLLLGDLTDGFDMPRYRAGRPLMAIAGWLLAGGGLLPIWLGLLAVGPLAAGLGAAASARLLAGFGLNRWLGVGFALVPGVAVGVTHATAEPLGLALAVLGVSLALRPGRAWPAGLAFAGAGLTKESYLLFGVVAAAVVLADPAGPLRARLRRAATIVLPGVAALAAWLGWVVLTVPGSDADAKAADALELPLVGWAGMAGDVVAGSWVADAPVGPLGLILMFGSLLLAVAGIAAGLRRPGLPGWTGLVFGLYSLCLSAYLLGHFLSSMRALAPCVVAGALALAAHATRPSRDRTPAQRPAESDAAA